MRYIFLYIFVFTVFSVKAQELPGYSQYMQNYFLLNPAVAGSDECPSLTITDRHQWIGIENAPNIQTITFHTHLEKKKKREKGFTGVGAAIINHNNGPSKMRIFSVSYAFNMVTKLTRRDVKRVAFGISFSGLQFITDQTNLTVRQENDPLLLYTVQRQFVPNANAGMYWYSNKAFVGISIANLIPDMSKNKPENTISKVQTHFFISTGVKIIFSDRGDNLHTNDIFMYPSILYKTNKSMPSQLDLNLKLFFTDNFWLGTSFRNDFEVYPELYKSLYFYVGMSFFRLSISYSYERALAEIQRYHSGNHEVMLGIKLCKSKAICRAYYY